MKRLKFESLNASSLKVVASLEFESLNGNPACKIEAEATRVARRTKAKDRGRTRRGSQNSPQARVRKFESLEIESLKPREFESSKASTFESSKSFKLWGVEDLQTFGLSNFQTFECSNFQSLKPSNLRKCKLLQSLKLSNFEGRSNSTAAKVGSLSLKQPVELESSRVREIESLKVSSLKSSKFDAG